jgi:Kef-type K+ transport system membrane component KefB
MFVAGLEIHLADLIKTGKPALFSGVLGVIAPIALGLAVVLPFGYPFAEAFFFGIALAATSVSISAQTLLELGFLRSKEGLILLGAAVADDVLAVAVLSAFVAIVTGGSGALLNILWVIVRMLLFLLLAFWLGRQFLPRLVLWVESLPVSQGLTAFAVVSALVFAWASEALGGVAAITGAFIAGVVLSTVRRQEDIAQGLHTLCYAFFVPVFLISIGLTANARLLSVQDVGLTVAVCLVAILSKLIGAGAGARLGGTTWREAVRVGVGMISRGEVGLIVAGVGVSNGIIGADVFTVVIIMVLVTTLVTPPLLRLAFRQREEQHG